MPSSSQSVSIHVLVVDDDPNVRGIVVRLLTRQFEDLRVTEATNGLEALDRLARERFTIALLDLTMPVMDGMDVLETIRRDPALRGMPVIMLTAKNDVATVRRIMDFGVTDFVLKPITPRPSSNASAACCPMSRSTGVASPTAPASPRWSSPRPPRSSSPTAARNSVSWSSASWHPCVMCTP